MMHPLTLYSLLVGWRSTCRDSGAQCIILVFILRRLLLPVGNWGTLLLLHITVLVYLGKKFEMCDCASGHNYPPSLPLSKALTDPLHLLGYGWMMLTAVLVLQPCCHAIMQACATFSTLMMWLWSVL